MKEGAKSAAKYRSTGALKWTPKTGGGFGNNALYGIAVQSHFRELGDHHGIAYGNQGLSDIQEVKQEDVCA